MPGSRRSCLIVLAALAALPACVAPAFAAGPATEIPVTAGSSPYALAAGPDGNLWFTELTANRIGRITPAGVVTEFSAGISSSGEGITAGPDGNLWFAEPAGRVGRITPAGVVTEFSAGITAGANVAGIAPGPDGNLWFTELQGPRIGRITPAGVVTEFSAGITAGAGPLGIAQGPDGNLWFTEYDGNRIGRITPTGTVTEFSAGITAGAHPGYIAAGPDGNLWFTEYDGNRIGRITPTGTVTEFAAGITAGAKPVGIAVGPDGNLWFGESGTSQVGRINLAGVVTEFGGAAAITAGSGPFGIAAGPDGNMWFAEYTLNRIGRLATDVAAPASGNLLRNPGFEEGTRPAQKSGFTPVLGWAPTPNFAAGSYGAATGYPPATVSDSIGGGAGFAWGGRQNVQSQAIQLVDVAGQSEAIDGARATARLSAFLGGVGTEGDNMLVRAEYLSAIGAAIGSVQVGPVTAADRGNVTTLLPSSRALAVPSGTRSIRVTASSARLNGLDNDGYVDNVSLTMEITPKPGEPGTGSPGGGPVAGADTVAPVLDHLSAKPSTFAVAPTAKRSAKRKRPQVARGTTLRFRLSEDAAVTMAFARKTGGRRSAAGGCVAPTRRNRKAKRCTRYVVVGTITVKAAKGDAKVGFSGRIGRKALKTGTYRLTATAQDVAGNFTKNAKSTTLTVVKR